MLSKIHGKKIVVFCPSFFGYEFEIKKAIEAQGAEVYLFDERPSNSTMKKGLLRLNSKLVLHNINAHYSLILDNLLDVDYFLFVNPEAVSVNILNQYRAKYPSSIFLMYCWDSAKNKPNIIELFGLFNRVHTFDKADALNFNLNFRPLFFIDGYRIQPSQNKYDFLFIGTAHTDRYSVVQKIKKALNFNFSIKEYYYLSSPIVYFYNFLRDKKFRTFKYKDIYFSPLSKIETIDLVKQSNVVIDINHPRQVGLTMRTIETIGARKKLITTNANILSYDFFDARNILFINRDNIEIDSTFLSIPYQTLSEDLYDYYSIHGWVNTIFEL